MSSLIEIKLTFSFVSATGKNKRQRGKTHLFLFNKIPYYYFFNYTKFYSFLMVKVRIPDHFLVKYLL